MYSVDNPCPSGILSSRRQLCFHQELFLKSPEHQKWGGGGGLGIGAAPQARLSVGGLPSRSRWKARPAPPPHSPCTCHSCQSSQPSGFEERELGKSLSILKKQIYEQLYFFLQKKKKTGWNKEKKETVIGKVAMLVLQEERM